MKAGYVALMRDGWIMDGLWTYYTKEQEDKAVKEANAEARSNGAKYQGSWAVYNRTGSPGLRGYLKALGIR